MLSQPTKPRVFISYSRADGEAFATDLRKRLEAQGLSLWQDRDRMEGGVGWWKQITDALEAVEFMVLVATPAAMQSAIVRKEWRYARQQGVCVYPVQVPGLPVDFASMPKWMRDSHFYNLEHEWETFLKYLKGPCNAVRVPFYGVPDLPEHFVPRPDIFEPMKAQLLDENRDNPVAITTSLVGAGGFGKTTLAAALCHDDDVQTAFDEGVMWVTLGENPNLLAILNGLYRALTGAKTSAFESVHEAAANFAEKLAENDVLLVIDDIWDSAHVKPFLQGGERCARLLTTRFVNITVDAGARSTAVDEMQTSEAVQMLLAGIVPSAQTELTEAQRADFQALADRLGEWPLMLEISNGMLREALVMGDTLAGALAFVNEVLDEEGIFGIERDSTEERRKSAQGVLAASFRQLKDAERDRLFELAIFVAVIDIPLTSIGKLWNTGSARTRRTIQRFARFSFVRFDAEKGTIRLHDVVREVLEIRLQEGTSLPAVHHQLITNYGDLTALPDEYAWRNLAHHLTAADQREALRALLLDVDFLHAKLHATDPNALLADCDALPDDEVVRLIRLAISIVSHFIGENPDEVLSQLYGRLLAQRETQPTLDGLLQAIAAHERLPALLTRQATLQAAGGPLIRTFTGHTDEVKAVAFSPDGRTALSASFDQTLMLWDVANGNKLRTFTGHTNGVKAVAFSPDGRSALSASADETLKLWDLATAAILEDLPDNAANRARLWEQYGVAVDATSPDNALLVQARGDTVQLWQRGAAAPLLTVTFDAPVWAAVAVNGRGQVVAGDRSGQVHILHPNPALRGLLGLGAATTRNE